MKLRPPRCSAEETARRGDELYEQRIRAEVEAGNHGRIVAIDIDTGAYALGDTALEAAKTVLAEHPDAEIWSVRIGLRALRRMGRLFKLVRP